MERPADTTGAGATAGNQGRIRCEIRDEAAWLTLDAPPLNILTAALMDEMSDALERVAADPAPKAVVIRAGGRAFSAGASVEEHRPAQVEAMMASFGRLFRLLDACELPIVIAVTGAALGGGFELAIMADILLAAEDATLGQPEIRLGFFAPVGVARLPALVGPARAMEITCSGRIYSAAEMQACGLVRRVVPAAQLDEAVEAYLKDFRRASPFVLRMNTRTLKVLRGRPFSEGLAEAERIFLGSLMKSADVAEGLAAFFEKRKPVWKNG